DLRFPGLGWEYEAPEASGFGFGCQLRSGAHLVSLSVRCKRRLRPPVRCQIRSVLDSTVLATRRSRYLLTWAIVQTGSVRGAEPSTTIQRVAIRCVISG